MATKPRTRKSKTVVVNMTTSLAAPDFIADGDGGQSLLNDLLASIAPDESDLAAVQAAPPEEIIEPVGGMIDDAALEAAAEALSNQEFYEQADAQTAEDQPEGDKPKMDETPVKGKRKAKLNAEPKAPKAAKTPKEPKPDAEPKAARVTFSGNAKSTVLDNRLGGRSADFLVLETTDALLTDEALKLKQAAIKTELDTAVAKKVAEKAIMLMKDLAGGCKVGNEVMVRAFTVLARDGFLTSGDSGNLQKALADKYSIGTARSQANQMFSLFPFLKITNKTKGRMEPNPNSTILTSVNAAHGLEIKVAA